MRPQGRAEAILTVQRATAEGIRLINESMPSDAVIKLKSLEAFAAAADGTRDEDHHPVRDPGRCRAGGRPGRERQGRGPERLTHNRIYTDPAPVPARGFR